MHESKGWFRWVKISSWFENWAVQVGLGHWSLTPMLSWSVCIAVQDGSECLWIFPSQLIVAEFVLHNMYALHWDTTHQLKMSDSQYHYVITRTLPSPHSQTQSVVEHHQPQLLENEHENDNKNLKNLNEYTHKLPHCCPHLLEGFTIQQVLPLCQFQVSLQL